MNILGINSAYHESSASLVVDGKHLASVEEERFSREKHAKHALISNPDQLPLLAIDYCLSQGRLQLKDIDEIGFSFNPERRLKNKEVKDLTQPGNWGSKDGEELFYTRLLGIPSILEERGFRGKFSYINHAKAHSASAFFPSPFEEAGIIAIDGIGEFESATLSYGNRNEMQHIMEAEYPDSVGFLWEKISTFLGYSEYDAGKVMSLGSFGNAAVYRNVFDEFISLHGKELFSMNNDILRFRVEDYAPLESLFKLSKREPEQELKQAHFDVAAALQQVTVDIMRKLAHVLHEKTGSRNLCMAGGVALNCVANCIIFEEGPFDHLFIQPATNDGGTSLGAALYLWNQYNTGDNYKKSSLPHTYWGPEFSNAAIQSVLDDRGLIYTRSEDIAKEVARLLSEGKVVGWFQGKMEYGPRALGNRSLLADPRDPKMRERLNTIVKHRESYRPFCPSVLEEEAGHWFMIRKSTPATDFMLMAYPVKESLRDQVPSAIHVDGTARIQTVKKETNPKFHHLISEFKAITGVPMLINTSFNDREPIVCSPEDAVNTLLKTGIDYLAIGDFLISKRENERKAEMETGNQEIVAGVHE